MQKLLGVPFVRESGRAQLVIRVIKFDKILDHGSGLPYDNVIMVWVFHGRETTIWVDFHKGLVLGV